jgi:hypothetical protein
VYFNGARTIERKTKVALQRKLAGVMIWELGQDARTISASCDRSGNPTLNDLPRFVAFPDFPRPVSRFDNDYLIDASTASRGVRVPAGDWHDTDLGWSAEGRIPWSDFAEVGGRPKAGSRWRASFCRYDYSVAFDAPDLSCTSPLTRGDFHRYEDYGWLRFVGPK